MRGSTIARRLAAGVLIALGLILLLAPAIAPHSYSAQFREAPNAPPSRAFPLGTDALGRDRWSRTLYGGRISLLCAPAAALFSALLALAIGLLAGMCQGPIERLAAAAADLCLSLPWLFALLAARAVLPLDAPPAATIAITFGMLGLLGWAGPARMILAAARRNLGSDFALLARASGCRPWRIAAIHLVPNLLPLAFAQFLVTVPSFLLAEANLDLLGLGIPEPVPSWGGQLRELENLSCIPSHPWILAPALLLFTVVTCFHLLVSADEYRV